MPKHVHPVIVSGFSSAGLATKIAEGMGTRVLNVKRKQHDDFEIGASILENLRGREVIVIASAAGEPNKQEKETRLLMRAANEAGAKTVTLVLPYMWYGRSDDVWDERQTPALVDTIEGLRRHCDDVIVADPHNATLTRSTFLGGQDRTKTCSIVHFAYPFARRLNELFNEGAIAKDDLMLMHADAGGKKRISRSFRACMNNVLGLEGNPDQDDWPMGIKDRDKETEKSYFKGVSTDVSGKDIVIFEDMIASGGTACELADLLKGLGAKSVTLCATSGLFTTKYKKEPGTASIERINKSQIDRVLITDTYDYKNTRPKLAEAIASSDKIEVVETDAYLASIITAMHAEPDTDDITNENSISAILRGEHPSQQPG